MAVSPSGEVYLLVEGDGPLELGGTSLSAGWGVAKFSTTGEDLWLRPIPAQAQTDFFKQLAHTTVGPVVSFQFSGTLDVGGEELVADAGGGEDVAIASFDAEGLHRWSLALNSSSTVFLKAVANAPSGNLVFVGYSAGVVTSGGVTVIDTPGVILLTVDPLDGSIAWARTMVEWSADAPKPGFMTVDKDGQIYLADGYLGTPDFGQGPLPATANGAFISRLSPTGVPLESAPLCEGACSIGALVAGMDGELYVSGFTMGLSTTLGGQVLTGTNTYLARLDGLTQATWLKKYMYTGKSGLGGPMPLAVQADGTVTFAHPFHGSLDFGLGLLVSEGELNVGVGKISPAGEPVWHRGFGGPNAFARFPWFAVQPSGEVTVALSLRQGSIDLGSGQLDEIGGLGDVVLARLAP